MPHKLIALTTDLMITKMPMDFGRLSVSVIGPRITKNTSVKCAPSTLTPQPHIVPFISLSRVKGDEG
jgi:hypothetical protein